MTKDPWTCHRWISKIVLFPQGDGIYSRGQAPGWTQVGICQALPKANELSRVTKSTREQGASQPSPPHSWVLGSPHCQFQDQFLRNEKILLDLRE